MHCGERFLPEIYAYNIQTWRDMQGPLLAAVRLGNDDPEHPVVLDHCRGRLRNLATFFMIVVEKTRDIGTLKALGASGRGVMSIFLSYGLLLGFVGSGAGLLGGLLFVRHINEIAALIEKIHGPGSFRSDGLLLHRNPDDHQPLTLAWVMAGAVGIAIMASVLPAVRAARMHPVKALRFE